MWFYQLVLTVGLYRGDFVEIAIWFESW